MKKLLVILLALLLAAPALAEDFASMTDDELIAVRDQVTYELSLRQARQDEQAVLLETDDIILYVPSGRDTNMMGYIMSLALVSKTEKNVTVWFHKKIINGWERSESMRLETGGLGRKAHDVVYLEYKNAYLKEYTEMQEIEFEIGVKIGDDYQDYTVRYYPAW